MLILLKHDYDKNISKKLAILWKKVNCDVTIRLLSGRFFIFGYLDHS